LQTPALLVDTAALEHNLATMADALPGARLRPHVKAHKCTMLAQRQCELGHPGFTAATIHEIEGLVAAGLVEDLLLANEVLDAHRLGRLIVTHNARITVAVDSEATIDAAVEGGLHEVVVDVNVGMPRCGCPPDDAGRLGDLARRRGLSVRGVMGYEGHMVLVADRDQRAEGVEKAMLDLQLAHQAVGGDLVSAGGTGTYDLNRWATEIQAGSYALMDTAYAKTGVPFRQAVSVLATVISVAAGWAVADCGLKACVAYPTDLGRDRRLSAGEVSPRVTERLPPCIDEGVLPCEISLERGPGPVRLEPVELDEQLRLRVREVDACYPGAVVGQHVELRHCGRKRETSGERRELRLEHAGRAGVVALLVEEHTKNPHASPPLARNPLERCLRGV